MSTPTGTGGEQPNYGEPDHRSGSDLGAPAYPSTPDRGGQAYPADPGYGRPDHPGGPGYVAPQQPQNGIGTTALVLGIIGLILAFIPFVNYVGGVLCIVAIILGVLGMQRAKQGRATNRGVAIGGLVTGVIGLLVAIAWAILIGIGISIFNSNGGQEAVQCIQQANGDQARIQECNNQFSNQIRQNYGS